MIPINERTPTALAVEKLVSELKNPDYQVDAGQVDTLGIDGHLRFVEVSSLIEFVQPLRQSTDWRAVFARLRQFLQAFLSRELNIRLYDTNRPFNEMEQDILALRSSVYDVAYGLRALEDQLKDSLRRAAYFSAYLSETFEHVQRRDALVVQSAPNAELKRYRLVSLSKIRQASPDGSKIVKCHFGMHHGLSSAIQFTHIEDIYECSELASEILECKAKLSFTIDSNDTESYVLYLHEFGEGLSPDRNECSLLSSKKARNAFYGKPELRNTEAPASMLTEWLGSAARGWTGEELAWSRSTLGAWMGEARAWSREELLARSKDLAVTELNHGDDTAMVYEELVSSTRAAALFSGRTHPFRKMF